MKELKNLASKLLVSESKKVDAIQDLFVIRYLDTPIAVEDAFCPMCNGKNGFSCLIDPTTSDKRIWFCAELDCLSKIEQSRPKRSMGSAKQKRALEWPLFCEMNNLGDRIHDVTFEKVDQTFQKKEFLRIFAEKPSDIILMQGESGTGKTYAALGLCELFTRKSSSCLFYSGEGLNKMWQNTFKDDKPSFLFEKIQETQLLVIDDFGTGEPSKGFMEFLMESLSKRLEWTRKGTVITTNLKDSPLGKFCGEALADRIMAGQKFEFTGKTRRNKKIL